MYSDSWEARLSETTHVSHAFKLGGASLVAQVVKKNLPAMQETQVRSLGQEDLLEKRMVTHSSIPAWEIPWTEEPGRLYAGYSPWNHSQTN